MNTLTNRPLSVELTAAEAKIRHQQMPPGLIPQPASVEKALLDHVEPLTRCLETLRAVLEPDPHTLQEEVDDLREHVEELTATNSEIESCCQDASEAAQDLRNEIDELGIEDSAKEPLYDKLDAILNVISNLERQV